MALDSRENRASAVHVGLPWRGLYPIGDGTISQADRQQTAAFYAGVLAGGPPPAPTVEAYTQAIPPGWRRSGERPT